MSTPTTARRAQEIALDRIEAGGNVRELDAEHVSALAGSMAVRGLIVPVAVRPLDGDRFALVAGEHRLAAARELGWSTIAAVISAQAEGTSGDQGAENVLRKTLTPLEEARAVEKMLADGYTVDGAATVLGWHKRRVTARRRILELPETAQTLVGSGEIPVAGIDALLEIQAVSPKLAALVAEVIAEASAEGNPLGAQLARDPGWLVRQALSHRPGELFAALAGGTLYEDQIAELKLGKKTTALYAEAKTLHGQLDRYAYGPPPVRIGEAELDQARAAGVLLELDRTQVILDRGVYRELVKAAVARTVEELRGPRDRARQRAARAQGRQRRQAGAHAARGGRRRAPRAAAGVHPPRPQRQPRPRRGAARRARHGRPGQHGRGAVLRLRAAGPGVRPLPRHRRPRRPDDRGQRHPPGARRAAHHDHADAQERAAGQDEGQLRRARGRAEVAVEVRRRRQDRRRAVRPHAGGVRLPALRQPARPADEPAPRVGAAALAPRHGAQGVREGHQEARCRPATASWPGRSSARRASTATGSPRSSSTPAPRPRRRTTSARSPTSSRSTTSTASSRTTTSRSSRRPSHDLVGGGHGRPPPEPGRCTRGGSEGAAGVAAGQGRRLPDGRAIRHANSRRFAVA